jgi:hypothetical protein
MGKRDDDDRSEKDAMWEGRENKSGWDDRHIGTLQTLEEEFKLSSEDREILESGELGIVIIIPNEGLEERVTSLRSDVIAGKVLLSPTLTYVYEHMYRSGPKQPTGKYRTYVTQKEVRDGYLREALDSCPDDREE